MTVVLGIPFKLTKKDVLRGLGMGVRSQIRPEIDKLTDKLLKDEATLKLIQPAFAYAIYSIVKIEGEGCFLDGGITLKGTAIPRLFPEARALAVAIATIGPMLETKVTEYFMQGHRLEGLILDAMGNSITENLRFPIHGIISKEAEKLGYTASSAVSPGSAGLPLSEQFKLFKLVPAGAIGVRLTESAMMEPRKSTSMVMGLGKNMPVWSGAQRCDMCSLGQDCPYRYQPEYECDNWEMNRIIKRNLT